MRGGINVESRGLGANYVLCALTLVSSEELSKFDVTAVCLKYPKVYALL